jgi:sugar lactone lactonase YvrE
LGGANLRTLYITTTRRKMTEEELLEKPEAGSLFQVEVPVPGLPEPEFNLSLM